MGTITLRLFGGARIEGDAGALGGRIAQRRQLALLAYLSLARAPVSRDRLVNVFWPEADAEHGRHALSDAVYIVRRVLGHAILASTDDVQLDRGLVRSDVDAFDAAIADGRPESAVALYAGPLLDGVHLSNSIEFEDWVARQRERYRVACLTAAEAAASRREASGDHAGAVEWWRRTANLDPHHSRVALGLARALVAAGDHAGAARHAAAHRELIEREFGVSAPDELLAFEAALRDGRPVRTHLLDDARAASSLPAPRKQRGEQPVDANTSADVASRGPAARASRPTFRRAVGAIAAAAVLLLGFAAARAAGWGHRTATELDHGLIAVLPMSTGGLDPSLAYLGNGTPELIAAKLATVERGLRAVVPRSLDAEPNGSTSNASPAPYRAHVDAARALGAGRMLTGGLVGTPTSLTIHVTMLDTRTGRERSRAMVAGPESDLHGLIDRLVAQLLSMDAGEEDHRLADLTTRSLPALRAFLEAREAHRAGDYQTALRRYAEAMDLDSTFALAGLGATQVAGWVGGSRATARRGAAIAGRYHQRLSERDRVGRLGRLNTVRTRAVTGRLQLEEHELALERWPDHPVLWYRRGDVLLHRGAALGVSEFEARARESFERAIQLNDDYAEPVHHLAALLGSIGDTTSLRRLASEQLARGRTGPVADHLRWRAFHALGDLALRPPPLDSMDADATLRWIGIEAQDYGFAMDDGADVVRIRARLPGTREEKLERGMGVFAYALNRGDPSAALAALSALETHQPDEHFTDRLRVLTALHADGDRDAASGAALRLAASGAESEVGELNACVVALWRLREGSDEPVARPRILSDAQALTPDSRPWAVERRLCALVRDARWLLRAGDPALPNAIRRLDRLLADVPMTGLVDDGHQEWVHVATARLHEASGDTSAALRALERRTRYNGWQPYLATLLREQHRLAASLGDSARAARAWHHYLAFRPAARD